ncbi:MAG: amidohydrolase family protein [Promethearchaeota archaeon]
MEKLTEGILSDEFKNLPLKYKGPKFDAHVHLGSMEGIDSLIKYREEFNIKKSVGIVWGDNYEELMNKFPNKFVLAKYFRNRALFDVNSDLNLLTDAIEKIHEQGYPIVKFWFGPRWRDYVENQLKIKARNVRLSDEFFDAIFSKIEDLGLILLIHVSDPDQWYEKVYQPVSRYGTKKEHLEDFCKVLSTHPKLKVLNAHFGAQPEPENLKNLATWFDRFPNLYVDTSSARWMAREFGREPEKTRKFFIKYSNRILFGSDIVQDRSKPISEYYVTRYLTFQALFESLVRNLPLPFPDPENNNNTVINGLDLPIKVLKMIYWENAQRLFDFK